jgi:hypothetical protein
LDLARRIDLFIQDPHKTLVGQGDWVLVAETPHEERTTHWEIAVNGRLSGYQVRAWGFPTHPSQPAFKIALTLGPNHICRVDCVHHRPHNNPPDARGPARLLGWHWHPWQENRRLFVGREQVPQRLLYADAVPSRIRRFDQAFRWFCEDLFGLRVAEHPIPDLPTRTRLL